ncbi:MAG: acetate--CoA ligase alpha subunit [Parcubacteria group bacterium]
MKGKIFSGTSARKKLDDSFFSPDSIAVVGASSDASKLGCVVLKNIIQYGFKGKVYAVNPSIRTALDLVSYPKVTNIPDKVDMAIIVTPSRTVPEIMNDCGLKGIKGAVIISSGFKEIGPVGLELENKIMEIARKYNIRVLGPNCLGFINTHSSLNATFSSGMASKGNVAFMSQSGALCQAILDWSKNSGIGFSKLVSLGNKSDINESDLIEAWEKDDNTSVVIAYLEGITSGMRFRESASALTRKKPFIVMKSGRTVVGSQAALSHTGAMAGSDVAYDAIFKQTGVIRVNSMEEVIDFTFALAYQPLICGDRIAIVTNAGGPGVMATDAVERAGLKLSQFKKETVEKLRAGLPITANFLNPVDVIGDATPDRYKLALEAVLGDINVDGVLVILTPQAITDVENTARAVIDTASNYEKPILSSFMGGPTVDKGIKDLMKSRIPNYAFPERAVDSFKAMNRYRLWRKREFDKIKTFPVDHQATKVILTQALNENRRSLSDAEARQVIGAYGLFSPRSCLAHNSEEAVRFADEIGYPVVMKIVSPDILHKTDIGGVKLNLRDAETVANAYKEIIESANDLMPQAKIMGIEVQEMIKGGREVIIGMKRDAQFGPLIMFGLGGIYVEILQDVSFRLAPIARQDAIEMIRETRSYPLLAGARGQKPVDINAIVEYLLRLSQLVTDFPVISELDINPLAVRGAGEKTIALECRIIIS